MNADKSAFQRIETMSIGELERYCQVLRNDIHVKSEKAARLKGDLQRQQNILAAAKKALENRQPSGGYRRR